MLGLLKLRKSSGSKSKGVAAKHDWPYHIPYGTEPLTDVLPRQGKDAHHLQDEKQSAWHDPLGYSVLTHAIPCRYPV